MTTEAARIVRRFPNDVSLLQGLASHLEVMNACGGPVTVQVDGGKPQVVDGLGSLSERRPARSQSKRSDRGDS